MVLVHGEIRRSGCPLHTESGDPVQRLSLGGAGLLDLRGPAQYVRGTHRDDRAGHSRHGRERLGFADADELDVIGVKPPAARSATAIPACSRPMAWAFTAPPVLSVDVNAGEQGHQVGDLDVLE
jgi:hypothetical protein